MNDLSLGNDLKHLFDNHKLNLSYFELDRRNKGMGKTMPVLFRLMNRIMFNGLNPKIIVGMTNKKANKRLKYKIRRNK